MSGITDIRLTNPNSKNTSANSVPPPVYRVRDKGEPGVWVYTFPLMFSLRPKCTVDFYNIFKFPGITRRKDDV